MGWVLNLDAEDELARGGPHTPTKVMRARIEGLAPALAALLEGDEVLWPGGGARGRATWGRAWCPTPWAVEQLRRAGLRVPPAPSSEVLRRVNHRKFAQALGQLLPAARFVESRAELNAALADLTVLEQVSAERSWLLKRPLGYAGRGRRLVRAPLSPIDVDWIEAALRAGGGLQLEPLVSRELDCALHGWLGADGALVLGAPTVQVVDASGTWQSTERAGPGTLSDTEVALLDQTGRQSAEALREAGFFGPFGIDAFRWRDAKGERHFQPRCELNARYSMGWAVGLGAFRAPPGAW